MELKLGVNHSYHLMEDGKIETLTGKLYRAQDVDLGRTVAVKCVPILGKNAGEKAQNLQKARSEVQALVRLESPDLHIPKVYLSHYDPAGSVFYIVMEWIPGGTLQERMQCPERQFLQWMIDLCAILERMEGRKLYHKDIKPQNIMITHRDVLYLIDFNISISAPNQAEGSLYYKAPEMESPGLYMGRDKADMFSIGVMLYEYYTGGVPVRGQDYARNRMSGPPQWDVFAEPASKNETVRPLVNSIILRCMKLDPRKRYSCIRELKTELIKAVKELGRSR